MGCLEYGVRDFFMVDFVDKLILVGKGKKRLYFWLRVIIFVFFLGLVKMGFYISFKVSCFSLLNFFFL